MTNEEIRIYRKIFLEIIKLSKKYLSSKDYNDIYEYYSVWEEQLWVNLLLFLLNERKDIPYTLWKLLEEFLEKYPADWTYLRNEPVDEFLKKLENSRIVF